MPYKHKRDKVAHAKAYWLKHRERQKVRLKERLSVIKPIRVPDTRTIKERINELYVAYIGDTT